MNREEVITEVTRLIEDNKNIVYSRLLARTILDWLDSIGYDPCFELGINIHGHSLAEMMG